jgi:hypothetical protein
VSDHAGSPAVTAAAADAGPGAVVPGSAGAEGDASSMSLGEGRMAAPADSSSLAWLPLEARRPAAVAWAKGPRPACASLRNHWARTGSEAARNVYDVAALRPRNRKHRLSSCRPAQCEQRSLICLAVHDPTHTRTHTETHLARHERGACEAHGALRQPRSHIRT